MLRLPSCPADDHVCIVGKAGLAIVGDPEVDWDIQGTDSGFPTSQSQEWLFIAALRAGSHSGSAHENPQGSSYRQEHENHKET
jgi:hypothetical protein